VRKKGRNDRKVEKKERRNEENILFAIILAMDKIVQSVI
jgi:hypothetical protein